MRKSTTLKLSKSKQTDGPLGDKPTSSSAKGAKAKVHELLSTGHAFTLDELLAATGATPSTLKTALSDLKSDKYCKPLTRLDIVKAPDGTYAVKPAGARTPAATPDTPPTAAPDGGAAEMPAAEAVKAGAHTIDGGQEH